MRALIKKTKLATLPMRRLNNGGGSTMLRPIAALNVPTEGGTVSMSLQPMFWAKIWGMLTDKFGTPWIVNGELQAL
jgi:hypothetical protein